MGVSGGRERGKGTGSQEEWFEVLRPQESGGWSDEGLEGDGEGD